MKKVFYTFKKQNTDDSLANMVQATFFHPSDTPLVHLRHTYHGQVATATI